MNSQKEPLEVYSNSVNFAVSIYDIILNFGLIHDSQLSDSPEKRETLVRIRMSPQHAKVMSLILADNINKYEKDVGEIKIPEKFLETLKKENQKDEGN